MKIDKVNKFWYVMRFQPHTNPQDQVTIPRVRHGTREEADKECIRLTKAYPNAMYVVLEAVAFAKIPTVVEPQIYDLGESDTEWYDIPERSNLYTLLNKEVLVKENESTKCSGYSGKKGNVIGFDNQHSILEIYFPGFIQDVAEIHVNHLQVK